MQSSDRKQKKIVQLAPHPSFTRLANRDNKSVSSSRGKKYFKISSKQKSPMKQILSSFTKKSIKPSKNVNDDYGLDMVPYDRTTALDHNLFFKNNKNQPKLDQPLHKSKHKLLKLSGHKKHRKFSQKAASLDSIIKINDHSLPKRKSILRKMEKSTEPAESENAKQIQEYEKTIEYLKVQNEYFSQLYMNSQQRIEALKRQSESEKKKFEIVRKLYQEKVNKLVSNKESCQKNLGHIYSYDSQHKDIVPNEVIVENSLQCSIDDYQKSTRKNSESTFSKLSVLSVNSR